MIITRNKKYMVTGVLTLAVLTILLGYGYYHNFVKEPTSEDIESFIVNNYTILNLEGEGGFISSDLFKKDLKKEVFLTGESHATSTNYDLDLAWIKYLHQEAGVRYLLREIGFGTGQLLNRYLETGEIREESIYQNFLKIYEHLPRGKFYGQWGAEHIFHKAGMTFVEHPFAARLQRKESPVKGKVVSIYYNYENSQLRLQNGEIYDIPNTVQLDVANEILSQENVLLKLTGFFSPFNRYKQTRKFGDKEYSFSVSENVQYILFIKNSPPDTNLNFRW